MLDYHVHLWPHPEVADAGEQRLERLGRYCEAAAARGVTEIALTEHLFRFRAGRAVVEGFWDDDDDGPVLRGRVARYFDHHATADLDDYVEAAVAARAAGLPVVVGLEVDYYPGRMDAVARLLDGYPFDVLLGSVHWLGAWMFDDLDDGVAMAEWDRRGTEWAWRAYTDALEELADTRAVDVLAHPDLVKVAGRRPDRVLLDESHDRIARAAARSGLAAELSSAGYRKPAAEAYPATDLLRRLSVLGVPLTTASDTHGLDHVGDQADELRHLALSAGYRHVRAFRGRVGHDVPLDPVGATRAGAEQMR